MITRRIKKLAARYDLWGEDPVHALGEIGGREFQFRASGGAWELQIAGYHGLPSEGDLTGLAFRGEYKSANIDNAQAAAIVDDCLGNYAETVD